MTVKSASTSFKIAFIGESVSGFGGMETVIKQVIENFHGNHPVIDCTMFFFCRNDNMDKEWLSNIDHHCSFSKSPIKLLRRAKHISAFSKWILENKPDVVICFDMISCLYAEKTRKKVGQYYTIFSWPHFSLDHKKHANAIVWADFHLAISNGITEQMIKMGIDKKKIHTIYNPVSTKAVIIPSPQTAPAVFVYIGRMKFEGQKRIKDLLDGLSFVKGNWILHVIGDGSDSELCKAYARDLGIAEHIKWYGWQTKPWDVVINDIRTVTALLLTSSFEGFPMTLLEAMSYGIPCISSDCMSGPKDIIKPGINGELYPTGDIKQFSDIVSDLISGAKTYNNTIIQDSIGDFYEDVYFGSVRHAIFSKINK
ncbi:MAG: lipopolysaccharide 1,6-galactosyltransferase [Leclercia sp.]